MISFRVADSQSIRCNADVEPIRVQLGPRTYEIRFGAVAGVACYAAGHSRALIVADVNVASLADKVNAALAKEIPVQAVLVPSGEASKSPAELAKLYDAIADLPADRSTLVVAVGGGMVGDLAGYAAATYARGLPWVMVPTTLLAMVDSSVGGKTGINHPRGKNLIGAFHQPAGVWIDLDALATLPDRDYRSGLAEVVKYGVSLDAPFIRWLELKIPPILARDRTVLGEIVARCCRLKAHIVEEDEREVLGTRIILNYGHTFAHAFEALGEYRHWLHGEAVSAGMVCAAKLAHRMGRVTDGFLNAQTSLLARFGLPVTVPTKWPVDALIDVMRRDKKMKAGQLRFVLPSGLGHVELVEAPEAMVREVLAGP